MKRYPILWIVVLFFPLLLSAAEKNKGELSNLVCFCVLMTKTTRSNSTNLSAITKRCLMLKLKELILYMAIFEKLLIINFLEKFFLPPIRRYTDHFL